MHNDSFEHTDPNSKKSSESLMTTALNVQNTFIFNYGKKTIEEKGIAIIAISPGNSFFNSQNISAMITCCWKLFSKCIIFIPDELALYNYRALNFEEQKAKKHTRLNANNLKNRANETVMQLNEKKNSIEY